MCAPSVVVIQLYATQQVFVLVLATIHFALRLGPSGLKERVFERRERVRTKETSRKTLSNGKVER